MALIPLNTFKTKTAVLTTAEYNDATCARDTGLIVDSIAFDLLYGYGSTNSLTQSIFSGLQYWAQDAIKIPGDILQTLAALDRMKEVSKQIVQNVTVETSPGYNGPLQEKNFALPGESDDLDLIVKEYELISNIIENGTKGVTDLIVPNNSDIVEIAAEWQPNTLYEYGTILRSQDGDIIRHYKVIKKGTSGLTAPTAITNIVVNGTVTLSYIDIKKSVYNSANLLLLNKELMQKEINAYITSKYNTVTYNKDKFIRNTRLLIDSLAFDLLFNSSSQSKFVGLEFWQKEETTKIPNQVAATVASIQRLKTVVQQLIRNELVTKSSNNTLDQYIDTNNPGNSASITAINTLFDIIINILNGSAVPSIISNTQITTYSGLLNAYKLIQENKLFIQEEIIAWIDDQITNNISPFNEYEFNDLVQREKCYRDTGYIVDCVSFDLVYTSTNQANRQSVQAGVYYYNRSSDILDGITEAEQSQTVTVFNYLRSLMDEIVTGKLISVTYQSDVKQLTNLPTATNVQSKYILNQINLVTNIIENGPTVINEVEPIGLIPSSNSNDVNGFRLLLANKDFLVAEAVAYIDNLTNSEFSLSGDRLLLCERDVGYIIDCIVFDLRHGGNRQAIHAGVYYYDHSSKISLIPKERIDTTEAFNHMRSIIEGVLNNREPTVTYQTEVRQFTNLAAISEIGTVKSDIIDATNTAITSINQIISSGPSSIEDNLLLDNRRPINLSLSTEYTEDLIKAFNLLLANRSYIVAEVIGYLNTKLLTRPNTTKIYTAPPGVTAIILMAQAANVSEKDVNVTFAHYRNIPVFADPATYNGYQAANTITELVKDFPIPPNNAASLIDGKMIVESFDSIIAYADASNSIKVTLSILETANA